MPPGKHTHTYIFVVIVAVYSLSHVQLFSDYMVCSLPGSSVHVISPSRILELVPFPPPSIFPTQGSNLHLRHCRRREYRSGQNWVSHTPIDSHQGNPLLIYT